MSRTPSTALHSGSPTKFAIGILQELKSILESVRANGCTTSREESTEGICAVAVPFRKMGRRVVAGLAVVVPTARLPDRRMKPVTAQLTAAAAEIEKDLTAGAGQRRED